MVEADTRASASRLDFHRLLELLPGVSTLLLLTSMIWGSRLLPAVFATLVLFYDIYWFYRSCSLGVRVVVAYRRMRTWQRSDWLAAAAALPGFERVHHLLVIPTYTESVDILRTTLRHVAEQDFPPDRLAVVLGFECRDPHARRRARLLLDEFEGQFGHLWASFHPDVAGEVAGKSSNEAWAARYGKERLIDRAGAHLASTTVTTCDADSRLPRQYFSALTYQFLTKPARRLYQPIILFYANIWRIPAPTRVLNSVHSLWQLAKLTRRDKLVPQSTYSMGLATCVEAGYWDVDVIPEDSHMFFKLLFRFGSEVRVEPLYLPVLADAAEGSTYLGSLKSQFNQEKRWAWGASDIPYILQQSWQSRAGGALSRWYRVCRYMEEHLSWPVGPFVLTFGGGAVGYFNHQFARTPAGHLLPMLDGDILTASLVSMVALLAIDWKLRPDPISRRPAISRLLSCLEWILMPVVGLLLTALPGLVAHMRLLFGRYIEYTVTEKIAPPVDVPAALPASMEQALSPVRARDY
ncbi:MAG: glycosyltransferase family 2 protein [Chloroflexota bacterium]